MLLVENVWHWVMNLVATECRENIEDDLSVVQECKDYLTSQINASKWGEQPLSFGIPMETLDTLTLNIMEEVLVSESSAIM